MEKDVVLNKKKYNDKFKKLLIKICLEFKINNYESVIDDFLKNNNHI